eukprot:m.171383 g.171383  ORF g.171383 m.171383 type:complete len:995 (+) comp17270_c0_seq2:240-3224(+)
MDVLRGMDQRVLFASGAVLLASLIMLSGSFFVMTLWAAFLGVIVAAWILRNLQVEMPSFLPARRVAKLAETPSQPASSYNLRQACAVCGGRDCKRHKIIKDRSITHPWSGLMVPSNLDEAMQTLVERIVAEYVTPWYSKITDDAMLNHQIKLEVRFMVAALIRRVKRLNVCDFILQRALPLVRDHARAYFHGRHQLRPDPAGEISLSAIRAATLAQLQGGHVALASSQKEAEYYRALLDIIVPLIISPEANNNAMFRSILRESFVSLVFQKSLVKLSDPDYLYQYLELGLDESVAPLRVLDTPSHSVELFANMCASTETRHGSGFDISLKSVMGSLELLKPFQDFLKKENCIELLMFIRNVENYVMCSDSERSKIARDVFQSLLDSQIGDFKYAKPLTDSIEEALSQSTPPSANLFQECYDIAFAFLEFEYCSKFLLSEAFFAVVCGDRAGPKRLTTAKAKGPNSPRAPKKVIGLSEAEIASLKLPPPPSALPDLHSELIDEEPQSKKKGKKGVTPSLSITPEPSMPSSAVNSRSVSPSFALPPVREHTTISEDSVSIEAVSGALDQASASPTESLDETFEPPKSVDTTEIAAPPPYNLRTLTTIVKTDEDAVQKKNGHYVYQIVVIDDSTRELGRDSWIVERRFSEFYALHVILKSYYKDYSCELPEKKAFRGNDRSLVEQRCKGLNRFLQSILENNWIHSDPRCAKAVHAFLQPGDEWKQFERNHSSQSSVSKVLNYVPPVWVAKKIMSKSEGDAQMESYLDSFIVTAGDLKEANKNMLDLQAAEAFLAESTGKSESAFADARESRPTTPVEAPEIAVSAFVRASRAFPHPKSIFDNIMDIICLAFKPCRNFRFVVPCLPAIRALIGRTAEDFLERFLQFKLDWILSEPELFDDIGVLTEAMFGQEVPPRTQEQIDRTLHNCRVMLDKRVPEFIVKLLGKEEYTRCTQDLLDILQVRDLNKQLLYTVIDALLEDLFPELLTADALPGRKSRD